MDNLRVYFVTYNVGTSNPDQELVELLGMNDHAKSGGKNAADFYVISLQEVSAKPTSMLLDALFEDPWTNAFLDKLVARDYVKLKTIRLQGLILNVFCLRKHLLNVREVESDYTRTGLSGMWGNKGAVSVRLSAYGCSLCFVNAHLTAHDEGLDDRVEDYNTIIKDQKFHVAEHTQIFFHDYVFWMGDLNFRLVEEFEKGPEEIDKIIRQGDIPYLFQHDQLTTVMSQGRAFSELIENVPSFDPTFKFDVGSCNYDYKRRPAWTDRILYKVNSNNYENVVLHAEQKSYQAHTHYTMSDHKPVTAEFTIKIPDMSILDSSKTLHLQVFEEAAEHVVQFEKVSCWYLGEENSITYKVTKEIPPYKDDWIGVFKENFGSLDDYIIYEYANKASSPVPTTKTPHNESNGGYPLKYHLNFSEVEVGSASPPIRLVYFSLSEDKVQTVLGVSEPIPLVKKDSD